VFLKLSDNPVWRPNWDEFGTNYKVYVAEFYEQKDNIIQLLQSVNDNKQQLQQVA
jgi:hypothetical protein